MHRNPIQFLSLATGQRVFFGERDADAALVSLLDGALDRGRIEIQSAGCDLVIERPIPADRSARVLDGVLLYLFQDRSDETIMAGGVICWSPAAEEEAWQLAQDVQLAGNVVCQTLNEAPPAGLWVAGILTQAYLRADPDVRDQIKRLDRAVAVAAVNAHTLAGKPGLPDVPAM